MRNPISEELVYSQKPQASFVATLTGPLSGPFYRSDGTVPSAFAKSACDGKEFILYLNFRLRVTSSNSTASGIIGAGDPLVVGHAIVGEKANCRR